MAPRRYWLSLQVGRHQRGALQTSPPLLRNSAFTLLRQGAVAGSAGSTCLARAARWWSGRCGGLKNGGDGGPVERGVCDQWPSGATASVAGGAGSARWKPAGRCHTVTQRRLAAPDGEGRAVGRAVGRGSGRTRSQTSPRNRSGLLRPQLRHPLLCEPRTGRDGTRPALRWARQVAIMMGGIAGQSAALRKARKPRPRLQCSVSNRTAGNANTRRAMAARRGDRGRQRPGGHGNKTRVGQRRRDRKSQQSQTGARVE